MHYSKKDIENLDRVTRLKIINSVTGIKPANLIGSIDSVGRTNVAIFSSVVHLGSNPAILGFISRPHTEDAGHTYSNIMENEVYTINHIHPEFVKNAHYTSGKFDQEISEFDRCGLTEEYIKDFKAPFVKESNFKMGLRFKEKIDIPLNGTVLIIGEIEELIIPKNAFMDDDIDLQISEAIGISGLNTYYSLTKMERYPYVRIPEVPEF
ncbi:flavin reductase family protein [Aequorivita lipolytica]|uniref:Flavin oxidoreductase n=1 Tax=Aequorivita lipolytica TaxID=153267 RepID=A0A5C6YLB6_9FLAO|nr:flavin reductase [Aequorivita lipolytica]TXD68197.1 flavin oxidoreductase [Aequorivita lipolytica]SRX53528.1 hypothetical protein AEQU2_02760 [Aequorivita lipolytica]